MATEYSVDVCRQLQERFHDAHLYRPMRVDRYDVGTALSYDITPVGGMAGERCRVRVVIEKFAGGGYAGQVYQVRLAEIARGDEGIVESAGLQMGGIYAMKILIPAKTFSRVFRNVLYWIGFQGPFQLQCNRAAARSGALWQKFIRRAAGLKFGDERAVVDIHATFVDETLGSCGEISEWIEGRTWQLEVDDRMDALKLWQKGKSVDSNLVGSPEYRAKREFMADFVELLHDMGGHEFARQYEWGTCKSQPNCLKRTDAGDGPAAGLTAVDFRAGLTLLPFLPMSPGDFGLIWRGLKRGSLVQFDRGDLNKLEKFVAGCGDDFADMTEMLEELKSVEDIYRNSVPDITHNHFRLLYSGKLWSTMFDSAVAGWEVRNIVDERTAETLAGSKLLTMLFWMLGVIPFLGGFLRRLWGRGDWIEHYGALLGSWDYIHAAVRGRIAEKVIKWHRGGRLNGEHSIEVAESTWLFFCHTPFSILPAGLHRFLTDGRFAKEKLASIFVRPVKLYFSASLREQWLRDMASEGRKKHILTDEDTETILSQMSEPYIQKYLVSLVVHLLTLPVTQIVSLAVAWFYVRSHPELTKTEAGLAVGGILVLFQITPISPGSICRGLWTVFMAVKDRNLKNYNIAISLSFLKYVGYLAFPIQMANHYPAMARFMASHWATDASHIVPVFGERGALLEHWVFCLFYNWPLTIRRRMTRRKELRLSQVPRYWHVGLVAIAAVGIFIAVEYLHLREPWMPPELLGLRQIWWLAFLLPFACGSVAALGCGGASLAKRIIAGAFCGAAMGFLGVLASVILGQQMGSAGITAASAGLMCVWRVFAFTVFSTMGAIVAELKLPDPDLG